MEILELLRDNISLLGQLETLGGQSGTILPGASRLRLREISSIASWMYSFWHMQQYGHWKKVPGGGTVALGPRLVRL